jgi:hypothetical protein
MRDEVENNFIGNIERNHLGTCHMLKEGMVRNGILTIGLSRSADRAVPDKKDFE